MYADDTDMTVPSMNIEQLLHMAHEKLIHISGWIRNRFDADPQKEYMVTGHCTSRNKVETHVTLTD